MNSLKIISQSLCFFLFIPLIAKSQKIKEDEIEYKYSQLPSEPLAKEISFFFSRVTASYDEENRRKIEEYEAEKALIENQYNQEMEAYPAKVQAAEDKYAEEMKAWEEKSLAEKIVEKKILLENNKPVKFIPPQPYKKTIAEPKIQSSYDYDALAGTYLNLDGYERNQSNAVLIEVTLNGYDHTNPHLVTEQKNMTSYANGTSTTSKVNYYHIEMTYRHAMTVKVTLPDGTELFKVTPQELNNYVTYKSPESTKYPSIDEQALVTLTEEKVLQDNLTFINNYVNDRIGFREAPRKTTLSYVKDNKGEYEDLTRAYNDATSGLNLLLNDPQSATNKLNSSVELWVDALAQSDINDKKARIDKDVTIAIYFNLLEAYFATGNFSKAEEILNSLNGITLSSKEKTQKDLFEKLISDLKKRINANLN